MFSPSGSSKFGWECDEFVVGPSRGRAPDQSATWGSSTWISQCNFRNTCLMNLKLRGCTLHKQAKGFVEEILE